MKFSNSINFDCFFFSRMSAEQKILSTFRFTICAKHGSTNPLFAESRLANVRSMSAVGIADAIFCHGYIRRATNETA